MIKTKPFKFYDLFRNTSGKLSGSGFIGFWAGVVGVLSFIAAMIGWFLGTPDTLKVMELVIYLIAISGALLGIRKLVTIGKQPPIDGYFDQQQENKEP